MTEHVACMLCGEDNYKKYLEIDGWCLAYCRHCGLIYLNPRPNQVELMQLYGKEYFTDRHVQDDHSDNVVRIEIEKRVSSVQRIGAEVSKTGSWLDVGCGAGYLLAAARGMGWSVQGVELSSWAGEFAMHSLNVPIHIGTLDSFREEVGGSKFDIITLMSYLEHSPNPVEDLYIVSDMLADGGAAVIRIPNVSSFDRYWHGSRWWGWHLPFHQYHFSPRTIKRTLTAAALRLYKVEFDFWNPILHLKNALQHNELRWDGPLEGRPPPQGGGSNTINTNPPWLKVALHRLAGKLLTGRDMIVYARKSD